jgi:hypothetical protein
MFLWQVQKLLVSIVVLRAFHSSHCIVTFTIKDRRKNGRIVSAQGLPIGQEGGPDPLIGGAFGK